MQGIDLSPGIYFSNQSSCPYGDDNWVISYTKQISVYSKLWLKLSAIEGFCRSKLLRDLGKSPGLLNFLFM